MNNVPKYNLNFKIMATNDRITSRSGLALIYETAKAIGLIDYIEKTFPKPGSNRGIPAENYIMSIILMLIGGGKYMNDIREIKLDKGLREACRFKEIPGSDAIAAFLKNKKHFKNLEKLCEKLVKAIIKKSEEDVFTLDTDATILKTKKGNAAMTYKGFKGYSSLLSFLAELDLCIAMDYRNGNIHAGEGIKEQIEYSYTLLKNLGKSLGYFRSDSAAYDHKVINYCFEKDITFTITADKDVAVMQTIQDIKENEWQPLVDEDGIKTGREYAVTAHTMNKSKHSFSLIVQRWKNDMPSLFKEYRYNYYIIATNDFCRPADQVIMFHNKRGNAENYNKELKNGYGLSHVPTQIFHANASFFAIGILAYNLGIYLKRFILGNTWVKRQVATLRWCFLLIGGKIINHGRQLILKVRTSHIKLFHKARDNICSEALLYR